MRHFDLSPLYRSTVGFDGVFNMLDKLAAVDGPSGYPPYNIERTGEHAYRITIAVAGFSASDLSLELKENSLTVRGEKAPLAEQPRTEFLHQGIAARAFERKFQVADHVLVTGARLDNGLLHVELVREIPEAKKPRMIPISSGARPAESISGAQPAPVGDATTPSLAAH